MANSPNRIRTALDAAQTWAQFMAVVVEDDTNGDTYSLMMESVKSDTGDVPVADIAKGKLGRRWVNLVDDMMEEAYQYIAGQLAVTTDQLVIGDGTANGSVALNPDGTIAAQILLRADSATYWRIYKDTAGNGHDLQVQRYNPADTPVDIPASFDWATGDVVFLRPHAGVRTTDNVTGSVGGAPDAQSRVGSTTATQTVAHALEVADGSRNTRAHFFLTDAASAAGGFGLWLDHAAAGLQPFRVGAASIEWLHIDTSGRVALTGAAVSEAHANADNLVIGGLASTNTGATILSTATGIGAVVFSDVSGAVPGALAYDHNAGEFAFTVETNPVLVVGTSYLAPAVSFDIGTTANRFRRTFTDGIVYTVQSGTSVTLSAQAMVVLDNSGGASTVTIPSGLALGSHFMLIVTGSATNNLIVDPPAGENVNGITAGDPYETEVLDTQGLYFLNKVGSASWLLHGPLALTPEIV